MKLLSVFLAICIALTALSACSATKSDVNDTQAPPSNDSQINNENGAENDENSDVDLDLDSDVDLDLDPEPEPEPEPEPDLPAPIATGINGKVTAASINIRETPGTKGKALGTVERDTQLLISKLQGVDSVLWGYTGEGYVCLDYVAFDQNGEGIIISGTVTADNLSVREAPHTFCEVIEKLSNGTRIDVSAFACFGTAIWGLTSYGWVCLEYVELDQDVEIAEGKNADKVAPFYLAPDFKEVTPSSKDSVAPTAESVLGSWEFVKLTSYSYTVNEERFFALKGLLTLNADGSFVCGYDKYVSVLYSKEVNVSSWDVSEEGGNELGGTYEVTENGIVLSYTDGEQTVKTVTLNVTQNGDMLFVKNPQDIVYTNESSYEKITHGVLYRNVSGSLLEKVYPGTYF